MQNISLLASIWTTIGNLLTGFFAIIPQTIYFLFTAAASLMDMLQYVVRKLAGLDVYYVEGTAREGDIVTNIVEGILGINGGYSILTTVFWAMIIFSVVLLVLATIIQMIRSHYDYDKEKSSPYNIIKKAVMGLLTLAIIPITTIFGMYISEGLLMGLDAITSGASQESIMANYEKEAVGNFKYSLSGSTKVYASLDFFHQQRWTKSSSFSGVIFNVSTHNSNRVRRGEYTAVVGQSNSSWENMDVFWTTNEVDTAEVLATQIDTAFEYCLTLNSGKSIGLGGDSGSLVTSYMNLSTIYAKDLINVKVFSKYDVGLVWYYYNLFLFDFFLGYAGIATGIVLLFNLILGLVGRLFYLVIMFIIYPPITALYPFDEGRGVKTWRIEYIKSYISVYSVIVGLNIVLLILPVLRTIKLFNNGFLDALMTGLFTLGGLVVIKKILSMFSKLIGAEDVQEVGGKLAKEFASTTTKAIKGVMKLADVGIGGVKALGASKFNAVNGIKSAASASRKHSINKRMIAANAKNKNGEEFKNTKDITDEDRENFLRTEQINKQIAKDPLKYAMQATEAMKADGGPINRARQTEYMQRIALSDLDKSNNSADKEMSRNGTAVDNLLKANKKKYGLAASNALNKKYGKDNVANMRKNNPEQYKNMLEEEERRAAAKDIVAGRKAKLRETGGKIATGFADITGEAFKLLGDMTQIKGIKDMLEKDGVFDAFKSSAQGFLKAVGQEDWAKADGLKTKKDKDKDEKDAKDKYRKNLASLAESYEIQSTTGQIEELTNEFKRYYARRLGREAVDEYFKKKGRKYKTAYNKFSNSDKELFTKYVQEDVKKADKFMDEKMEKDKPKENKGDLPPLT